MSFPYTVHCFEECEKNLLQEEKKATTTVYNHDNKFHKAKYFFTNQFYNLQKILLKIFIVSFKGETGFYKISKSSKFFLKKND